MKIIYAGTPQFAVAPLKALCEQGYEVIAVITQEDKPTGRKGTLTPPPVKVYAQEQGIAVYQYDKIKNHVEEVLALGADVMITCAYGQMLPERLLLGIPKGVWNIHASLLPKFRGASPIQSAILAGETHTGVTIMKTELKMDAGDILMVKRCAIGEKNCAQLSEELSLLGAEAIVEAISYIQEEEPQLMLQDEMKVTTCKKINKQDAWIDFSKSCEQIVCQIRAMNPSPVAYAVSEGKILNIYEATCCEGDGEAGKVISADKKGILIACGKGAISVKEAQWQGGKRLSYQDLVNGRKIVKDMNFDKSLN